MGRNENHQIAPLVGANIRAARDAREWSQKQLADAIGEKVTNRDVSRWETGLVEPGPMYRRKLADLLFDGNIGALYAEREEIAA